MSIFNSSGSSNKKVVPIVDLKGVIMAGSRGGLLGDSKNINIDGMRESLTKAFNTAGAVAVALDINSPGGSPTQSELVGDLIRELSEKKNIPVYAFAQDVAASGGYWLACAADEIFAAKTSTIGSIGVVTGGIGYHELAEKHGIENRTFTAGKAKRRMSPLEPVKQEDRDWMNDRLEKMHVIFKDWIMERRGDKLVAPAGQNKEQYLDDNVFTGDTWFGQEAVDMGLIDGIGSLHSVMKEKYGDDISLERIKPKKKSLVASLMSAFGGPASGEVTSAEKMGAAAIEAAREIMREEIAYGPFDMR